MRIFQICVVGLMVSIIMHLKIIYRVLVSPIEEFNKNKEVPSGSNKTIVEKDGKKYSEIEVTNPTTDFLNGFNNAWICVQVCLYKLYKENELLDFDSLFIAISSEFELMSKNRDELRKWNIEYLEYMNAKKQAKEDNSSGTQSEEETPPESPE